MSEGLEKGYKDLTYADLGESQEKKMREVERKFNNEFGTNYYFMIMEEGK
jgi:hypothetical protein